MLFPLRHLDSLAEGTIIFRIITRAALGRVPTESLRQHLDLFQPVVQVLG